MEPTNAVLLEKIENLTKSTTDGFKGVHDRQDKTNGKVIKNTEYRIRADATVNFLKWMIGVIGVGNIALIVKVFLT